MKKERPLAPIESLRKLFAYDPLQGGFIRLVRSGSRGRIGPVHGCLDKKGYLVIGIGGRNYFCHRLAWALYYGEWPNGDLDHIDGEKTNNKITNLRIAKPEENNRNKSSIATNTSGFRGVCIEGKKFRATIRFEGKKINLGTYETAQEAHAAYVTASKEYFGDFHRQFA